MNKNIKRIQAALNLLDPDQAEMYYFVKKRTNESAYIKRLIQRDMEGMMYMQSPTTQNNENDKKLLRELIL